MSFFTETWASIGAFLEMGGPVLYAILGIAAVMWALIIERLWYLLRVLPREIGAAGPEWDGARRGLAPRPLDEAKRTWYAVNLRRSILSRVGQGARRNLTFIQTLMQVLPLLGLLGTVWGMVHVFDIMTVFGTGNARLMASGVSRATIPTMSGLVAALSGLYLIYWLRQRANHAVHELEGNLKMEISSSGGEAVDESVKAE